jgi:outer membrane protein
MKQVLTAFFVFCAFATGLAQQKIGYISTEELMAAMPEAAKAEEELREFEASLNQQGQDMMDELNRKDSIYVADSMKLSATMREIKKEELFKLYQEAQNWKQQAQEKYQAEAQKKIAPIRTKALEAVRATAKDYNYAYILDINSVIVGPPGDDVLPLVKKKLGIKSDEPKKDNKRP